MELSRERRLERRRRASGIYRLLQFVLRDCPAIVFPRGNFLYQSRETCY